MQRVARWGKRFRSWSPAAGLILFLVAGCATQADIVDAQGDLERLAIQNRALEERLRRLEGGRDTAAPGARGQADMVLRSDQLAAELQALTGRLEQSAQQWDDLSKRLDDQEFRAQETTARLDSFDAQLAALQRSVTAVGEGIAALQRESTGAAPGADGAAVPPVLNAPQDEAGRDEKVMLPGRPTERNKTTGVSPSEAYGLAYNDYLKGNYDLSLMGFQNYLSQYKATSLAPNAQYWLGESYYGKKDYGRAVEAFDRVVNEYPRSDKVPAALLKAGYAFAELGDKTKAKTYLKRVVESYPFSNEAKLAKNRLAEIK